MVQRVVSRRKKLSKPFIYKPRFRRVTRQVLLWALAEEVEKGTSGAKLFSAMLAKTLFAEEPNLEKYRGVFVQQQRNEDRALRKVGQVS